MSSLTQTKQELPSVSKSNNEEIKLLINLYEDLKSKRSPWLSTWKTLADNFDSTGYRDAEKYDANNADIINKAIVDTTGILAARTLAAGMQGGMTSPARPWFNLRVQSSSNVNSSHDVQTYTDEVSERMRVIFQSSNFYNVMFQAYQQLGVFGTTCVLEEATLEGFTFTCMPVGTYVLDVDSKGRVDTVIRKIWLTVRQLIQEFGEDVLPEKLRFQSNVNGNKANTEKYAVFHAVTPRSAKQVKIDSVSAEHKPYKSIYYMDIKDSDGNIIVLRESGFDSFPFFGVRWDVQAGDIYGKSPAMDIMGSCMLLQKVVQDTAEGIHKQVNPPVNAPAELQSFGVDLSAGAVNWVHSSIHGNVGVTPTLQVGTDVNAAMMYIQQIQMEIKTGMYNDLFRMLMNSDRRSITATEIASKEQEKLILIGPVLERLQDELFNPLIRRTFELMAKYDALPEAPESMQDQGIKVEFVSTLAQAQKIVSTGGIEQLMSFVGNVAGMKPEALDAINIDTVIDKYSEYLGTDAGVLLSTDERNKIRQGRAKAQQGQEEQQAMMNMTQMANTLGNTPTGIEGNPNALDAMVGGLGRM